MTKTTSYLDLNSLNSCCKQLPPHPFWKKWLWNPVDWTQEYVQNSGAWLFRAHFPHVRYTIIKGWNPKCRRIKLGVGQYNSTIGSVCHNFAKWQNKLEANCCTPVANSHVHWLKIIQWSENSIAWFLKSACLCASQPRLWLHINLGYFIPFKKLCRHFLLKITSASMFCHTTN